MTMDKTWRNKTYSSESHKWFAAFLMPILRKGLSHMKQSSFTEKEKSSYPLIGKIREGLTAVAIDPVYKGLLGIVTEVLKDNSGSNLLDAIVDFYDPFEDTIEESHHQLNGMSFVQVIKSEADLAFFFDEGTLPVTADGTTYDLLGNSIKSGDQQLTVSKGTPLYIISKGTGSNPRVPQVFMDYTGEGGAYQAMKSQYQKALSEADGNLNGVISGIEANIAETQAHINYPDQIDCEDNLWWFITECIAR
jgi:hypothetical protein